MGMVKFTCAINTHVVNAISFTVEHGLSKARPAPLNHAKTHLYRLKHAGVFSESGSKTFDFAGVQRS